MIDDRLRVMAALAEFYTPEEAETWLTNPHPLLGGRTADELIAAGRIEEVLRLLDQLREGVYL